MLINTRLHCFFRTKCNSCQTCFLLYQSEPHFFGKFWYLQLSLSPSFPSHNSTTSTIIHTISHIFLILRFSDFLNYVGIGRDSIVVSIFCAQAAGARSELRVNCVRCIIVFGKRCSACCSRAGSDSVCFSSSCYFFLNPHIFLS